MDRSSKTASELTFLKKKTNKFVEEEEQANEEETKSHSAFFVVVFFFLVFHIDKLFILDLLAMNLSLIVPYWSMTFIIVINLRIRTDFPLHLHLFIYCSSHASIRDSCCHHTRENSKNSIDQWNGFSSNSVICFPTLSKYWWTVIAAKARIKKKHTTIFQLFILNEKWMICRN